LTKINFFSLNNGKIFTSKMTTAIVVAEAQPIVLKELSADYTEQLGTTMLAILDTIEQTRRKARQTYLDIKEFYEGSEKIQKMVKY